jgi:serine/threonine protein kinase/tetratricopeptide (TPR) repeat protein
MDELTASGSAPAAVREHDPDGEPQVRYLSLARLEPGTVVRGRYRVERLIGQGGFGMVFAAQDLALKAPVALKFLDPRCLGDERKFLRVQREINLSRRIRDPRIVRIYSLEDESGVCFMVMERIGGQTLKERLRRSGPFRWQEFRPIFAEVLAGVASLHGQGIIHRDLKPSNIMVDDQGQVRILDFGLAKEIGDLERTSSLNEIVGSPFYLSPEQIQGAELGVGSDIYQLGILLYQSLTDAYPFPETSTMSLVLMHLQQKPEPVAARGIAVPGVVEFAVAKALAKRPRDRFRSAAEMAACLERERAPLRHSLGKRVPRALRLAALLGAAALLGFAAFRSSYGSARISSLRSDGSVLAAVNRFGRTVWRHDFAPFTVHTAWLAEGPPQERRPDQQNPIRFVNESFLGRLPTLGSPLAMAFLSHPGMGVFPADASIASADQDNQLAVLDARGRLVGRDSYVRLFGLRPYDFSPVFTLSGFRQAGGGRLTLFHLQNFQGMYPSAQVALKGATFSVLCSPGSMMDVRVLEDGPGLARLLVLGANNLVSHLGYLTEMSLVPGVCATRGVPPNTANDLELESGAFLAFLPRRCRIVTEEWRTRGRVRLLDEQERESITVYRDGRLEVEREGRVTAYRDGAETLERAYNLLNRCFQQRSAQRNPEKALQLADAAAALAVRNPYLRSAIQCLKGDCEVRLGRFAAARRSLEEALRLFPRNNDALAKLLETSFLENGPLAAIALIDGPYSQIENVSGLGIGGLLLRGECYLAAGQMEKARECFERIYQQSFPDSREALQAELELFAGRPDQALRLLRRAEHKVPGFFDVRELRLLLARAMLLSGGEPARCRWILEDLAKFSLRQGPMTEISLCYLLAAEGKREEARERIAPAFAKLRQTARGDLETRLWLWYDAWVYARAMELLGDAAAARAGYRACIEANPHVALAGAARRALAGR